MKFNPSRPTCAARRYTVRTVEFQNSPILSPMDTAHPFTGRMGLGLNRNLRGVL
ncbi:hypothetical protein PN441_08530 [Spirulina major CS-329]|jgi:hypothetical protein|uniref:hypothetical protein n=1 Tax=Spirulina TaxID=1154 RepID=UPI00232DA505|nr:hypothetical protein [Spirulina subsalsa]MDB9496108.1 hypothetical protein [Spirulina subsalsa CS-330]MDB9503118.1 hypothetical protein [Spirulina major CS-329]